MVYEDVDKLFTSKASHTILMEDFNAKIGIRNAFESSNGPYGYESRNSRGDTLVNFAEPPVKDHEHILQEKKQTDA